MQTNDFVKDGKITFRRFYLLPVCGFENYYVDLCIDASNSSVIEIFFRNLDTRKSLYFVLEFLEHKLENLRVVKKEETSLLTGTTTLSPFYSEDATNDEFGKFSILGSQTTERLFLSIELLEKEDGSQLAKTAMFDVKDFLSIEESDHWASEVTGALNRAMSDIPFRIKEISLTFQGAFRK